MWIRSVTAFENVTEQIAGDIFETAEQDLTWLQ
jgi:hypothetical protein